MADGFVPPQQVRSNAKRGLELREKHGRGGTEVGVARARDLSNGKALSLDTIKRMNSYFARHEVDKKGEGWGEDSAGYIAWLLWGGDSGWAWAKKILREQENKEKSQMTDLTTSYFAIEKADKNSDGTLMVYGKATDDSLDIDKQICDSTWLDRAMPEWFKTGGNIREQHSNIAAGVAKEYDQKSDGHYISALVVDPISVKKVETGVLKGFSIGIKSPRIIRDEKAANGRIVDGQIVEVSLVDRPANPNAKLTLAKSVNGEINLIKVEEFIIKEDDTDYEEINTGGEGSEPSDKELYNRVKAEAKQKFDVYPSAVANAWVVRTYKERGGKYKKKTDTKKGLDMEKLEQIVELAKSMYGESAEQETAEGPMVGSAAQHELEETKAETTDGCDCEGCKMCKESGGCDKSMCKGHKSAHKESEPDETEEKSANKCLECGCHKPADSHGRDDVSTAVMVSPDQTPKSAEKDSSVESEDTLLSNSKIAEIIEKAINSATESIRAEIETIKSAKNSAEDRADKLDKQLAEALTKAVGGGPKRTSPKAGINEEKNNLLVKSAIYAKKAKETSDPVLAEGYRQLSKQFEGKLKGSSETETE